MKEWKKAEKKSQTVYSNVFYILKNNVYVCTYFMNKNGNTYHMYTQPSPTDLYYSSSVSCCVILYIDYSRAWKQHRSCVLCPILVERTYVDVNGQGFNATGQISVVFISANDCE